MSDFSSDWLALREHADHAARSVALVERLQPAGRDAQTRRIVDLGTGTGSNLRALAGRLGGRQHWRLVDHDQALLDLLPLRLAEWAERAGLAVERRGAQLRLLSAGLDVQVRTEAVDLAADLAALDLANCDLVTAAALLDLTSRSWVDALVEKACAAGAAALFALNYDGRIDWYPAVVDDDIVRDLFNAHQQTDKGFGMSLGPRGGAYVREALDRAGYRTSTAASDWRLHADDQALQLAFLDGQATAATECRPDAASRIDDWATRRRAACRDGESTLRVGHVDVLGLPTSR